MFLRIAAFVVVSDAW